MDKRIRIWNLLHDGEITAVSGEGTETLTMFVNIPFLRRRIEPLGDSFVLTLEGLTCLKFQDFEGNITSLREEIDVCVIEILSTDSESMPVKICTMTGELTLDFQDIRVALDTGQTIEYEIIENISQAYWTEFGERTRKIGDCPY